MLCACKMFQLYIYYNAVVIGYILPLTQDGVTPLYIASQKGHSDVMNIIRNGADINLPFKILW